MLRTASLVLAVYMLPLPGQQSESARPAGRHVSLILEQALGSEWRQVDPHTVFKADDQIRFRFRANFGGYLYVLNETGTGEHLWLFPTPETGLTNQIEAGREYVVPATSGSFLIPPNAGYDIVYWIVSPLSFPELPAPPRNRQFPQHTYSPLLPRCRESSLQARGLCLDGEAGAAPVADPSRLPPALAPRTLQPRALDVHEDGGQSRISVAGPPAGPFLCQFRIAHR